MLHIRTHLGEFGIVDGDAAQRLGDQVTGVSRICSRQDRIALRLQDCGKSCQFVCHVDVHAVTDDYGQVQVRPGIAGAAAK